MSAAAAVSEVTLLMDEEFDFDLSLTPESDKENSGDDEVFIGPVGHKEKCVAVCVEIQKSEAQKKCPPKLNDRTRWSPLSGDKFVEIFKEAHLLALQLENSKDNERNRTHQSGVKNPAIEKFVQESKSKLNIFQTGQENDRTPVVIKRETYCVNDSPFHLLPPSIQQRLDFTSEKKPAAPATCKGSPAKASQMKGTLVKASPAKASPIKGSLVKASPAKASPIKGSLVKASPAKASPLKGSLVKGSPAKASPVKISLAKAPTPKKVVALSVKGKMSEPHSVKHPAPIAEKKLSAGKSQPIKTTSNVSKSNRLEVPKLKPRSKLSPLHKKHLKSAESSEDVHSDKSSVCSDLSDSSFNNSTISAPSKFGMRKSQLKLPCPAVPVRRKTSSSSSHSSINSSFNSSLSVSPQATHGNSLNASMNSSRLSCNTGLLSMVRPSNRLSSTLQSNSTDAAKKMIKSRSAGKLPVVRGSSSKPGSFLTTHPPAPVVKLLKQKSDSNLQRLSLQNKPQSAVQGNLSTKPTARVEPTPTTQSKLSKPSGVPKIMQPKRLLISSAIGSDVAASTPVRPLTGGVLENAIFSARSTSITLSAKHGSALPTPMSRKFFAIPAGTPQAMVRSYSSPQLLNPHASSTASKKTLEEGQKSETQLRASSRPKSSSSEEEALSPNLVPLTLDFSPERYEMASIAQRENMQNNELLLIDVGIGETSADIMQPETKPLIDLSNTPVKVTRRIPLKSAEPLIDLTSPLILLSPDKENLEVFSPLLKF